MICAQIPRHRNTVIPGRPRNLFGRALPHKEETRAGEIYESFKEPNRKAVFRSTQWPARSFVTIPCRGSSVTLSPSQVLYKPGGRAIPKILKSATHSEYQRRYRDARAVTQVFRRCIALHPALPLHCAQTKADIVSRLFSSRNR